MTYLDLSVKVATQIRYAKVDLSDSPRSALALLERGIGYVEAVGEMYNWNVTSLINDLEQTVREMRLMD